jgi:hypothetical protein
VEVVPMTLPGRQERQPRWAGLAWALWVLTLLGLAATAWLDALLRQAGQPALAWLGAGNAASAGAAVVAATVGALVASRRPRHPVGWLLVAMGLSVSLSAAGSSYKWYGLGAQPGSLPAASYLAGLSNGLNIVYVACGGFVLLLTPTGTLPSRRWRWWARVAAAAAGMFLLASALTSLPAYPEYPGLVSPIGVPALDEPPLGAVIPLAGGVVLVALVVAAGSLVGRFRRARGVERQQLRWLAWGAALAALALVAAIAELALHGDTPLFQAALGLCLALLPVATGAAILRYRLYDLDRIISRTLAWGLLTLLLGLGYAGVVLGLGRLLPEGSSLVVAAATLTVAAAFQPARRRIQQAVDRRFNRRRYDAARTIEAFSDRLRQQVDLNTLTVELLAVVDETMQPTQASLWLRPQALSNARTATARGR